MQYRNTEGELVENKPNPRFKNYKELFNNLLKTTPVVTEYSICSVIISYNSKWAITVTKKDDKEYYIKMYNLETYNEEFQEKIGGNEEDYIKLKEVEQNIKGDKFAIVYFNDGEFRLRTFECKTRTEKEIAENELNINKLLGLNNWTMAISGFPDPYITCCFVEDNQVFINLFYNYTLTHYHFVWDIDNKKVVGEIVSRQLECSKKNFPYKCFYNEEKKEIYSFYRQGQAFKVFVKDENPAKWTYQFDKMTDADLG